MPIKQAHCAAFLSQCTTTEEVDEVLSAYIFSKYLSGNSSGQCLRKLHLLTLYLRAMGMEPLLKEHHLAFARVAQQINVLDGLAIGSLPTSSPIGTEAWNAARRHQAKAGKRVARDSVESGGPGQRRKLGRTVTQTSLNESFPVAGVEVTREELDNLGSPPVYQPEALPDYHEGGRRRVIVHRSGGPWLTL